MGNGGVFKIAAGVLIGLLAWNALQNWRRQRALDAWVDQVRREEARPVLGRDERCELGFVVKLRRDAVGRLVGREFTFSDAAKKVVRTCP